MLVFAKALLLCRLVLAQHRAQGRHAPQRDALLSKRVPEKAIFTLPRQDNEQLRRENGTRKGHPLVFAAVVGQRIDAAQDGVWTTGGGVRRWRAAVQSAGATALGLHFGRFRLPPGSEFYVHDNVSGTVHGAYLPEHSNQPDGRFLVTPLATDSLTLEYVEPVENGRRGLEIVLEAVAHGFSGGHTDDAWPWSAPCQIDSACAEGANKESQKKATVLTIVRRRSASGHDVLGYCSGVLVNNHLQDGTPLVLTASHCVSNAGEDGSNALLLDFRSDECVSRESLDEYRRGYGERVGSALSRTTSLIGMALVAQNPMADVAVYQVSLTQPLPDDAFLAGWDRTRAAPAGGYGLHHPRADVEKVSLLAGATEWTRRFFYYPSLAPVAAAAQPMYWRVVWEVAATEPGSSGSPLFNQDGRVVGTLWGGESSCEESRSPDYYGALWAAWAGYPDIPRSALSEVLDPRGRLAAHSMPGIHVGEARRAGRLPRTLAVIEARGFPAGIVPFDAIHVAAESKRAAAE